MPDNPIKMMIAGVGGQGIVFLTNLLTEAAILADIPAASSEIHGLAQRRGSVTAGVTFGANSYGYVEAAGTDFLIGLEPLEALRCLPYLNRNSRVIIDDNPILPHSVNTGKASYPDVKSVIAFLRQNVRQVIYNQRFSDELPPVLRNTFILGRSLQLGGFPLPPECIAKAIAQRARRGMEQETLKAFQLGLHCNESTGISG